MITNPAESALTDDLTSPRSLPHTTPEAQGIESAAILAFVQAVEQQIHELHSFVLLRHGVVVAEGWWSPYRRDIPHLLFSVSKSFTATAVGLAIAEGRLTLDDPVLSFFPEAADALAAGTAGDRDLWAAMQVRHLLTMSTGQAFDSWSAMIERADGDWIRGFLEVPVVQPPGSQFVYNTGATYLLSAIIQRVTGEQLVAYLEPRLFAPLGIRQAAWQESPQGITAGGIGLSLTTEDLARFGQLYLQQGMWQGRQLLPAAWVEAATSLQIANDRGGDPDWSQGYGYQFWRSRHGAYRGDGVFGQFCIVMPEQDAVLAITAGVDVFEAQPPLDLVWKLLLPAMHPDPLPADPQAEQTLRDRLATLSRTPVQGQADSSVSVQAAARTYRVEANPLHISTLALEFSPAGGRLLLQTAAGSESITWGYQQWQMSETGLFRQAILFDRTPVAASGAWTAPDVLTLNLRLVETPFYYGLTCHFAGDELLVEIQVNVSMESLKPVLLLARQV